MADPAGWPAIIGMVGGVVGLLGGLASFGDRFYKGGPVGSLTTQNSFGNNVVLVRIKNTTNYDVVITFATERKGVYFLADRRSRALRGASSGRPHSGRSCSSPTMRKNCGSKRFTRMG